ncbi:unnamed protein product, partial [Trichogramma brassicae]
MFKHQNMLMDFSFHCCDTEELRPWRRIDPRSLLRCPISRRFPRDGDNVVNAGATKRCSNCINTEKVSRLLLTFDSGLAHETERGQQLRADTQCCETTYTKSWIYLKMVGDLLAPNFSSRLSRIRPSSNATSHADSAKKPFGTACTWFGNCLGDSTTPSGTSCAGSNANRSSRKRLNKSRTDLQANSLDRVDNIFKLNADRIGSCEPTQKKPYRCAAAQRLHHRSYGERTEMFSITALWIVHGTNLRDATQAERYSSSSTWLNYADGRKSQNDASVRISSPTTPDRKCVIMSERNFIPMPKNIITRKLGQHTRRGCTTILAAKINNRILKDDDHARRSVEVPTCRTGTRSAEDDTNIIVRPHSRRDRAGKSQRRCSRSIGGTARLTGPIDSKTRRREIRGAQTKTLSMVLDGLSRFLGSTITQKRQNEPKRDRARRSPPQCLSQQPCLERVTSTAPRSINEPPSPSRRLHHHHVLRSSSAAYALSWYVNKENREGRGRMRGKSQSFVSSDIPVIRRTTRFRPDHLPRPTTQSTAAANDTQQQRPMTTPTVGWSSENRLQRHDRHRKKDTIRVSPQELCNVTTHSANSRGPYTYCRHNLGPEGKERYKQVSSVASGKQRSIQKERKGKSNAAEISPEHRDAQRGRVPMLRAPERLSAAPKSRSSGEDANFRGSFFRLVWSSLCPRWSGYHSKEDPGYVISLRSGIVDIM